MWQTGRIALDGLLSRSRPGRAVAADDVGVLRFQDLEHVPDPHLAPPPAPSVRGDPLPRHAELQPMSRAYLGTAFSFLIQRMQVELSSTTKKANARMNGLLQCGLPTPSCD